MIFLLSYWIGYILDLVIGDPEDWPHPIRFLGRSIDYIQNMLRGRCSTPQSLRIGGFFLWTIVVGGSYVITALIINVFIAFSPLLGLLVQTIIVALFLATRSLREAAHHIFISLRDNEVTLTRKKLSYIVGRDTTSLNESAIARATVETVAENSVDGVIAPLFYLFIGGVPLMVAYKAVNTLDSMVGYKNAQYADIGLISAKMDDLCNFIPARLSLPFIAFAAFFIQLDAKAALTIGWRDRYQHKSPNSAWSEAAFAGALGVQLGGPNRYFGVMVDKPTMGDELRPLVPEDIHRAISLMLVTSLLVLIFFSMCFILFL